MPNESRSRIIILDIDGTVIDTPSTYAATGAVKEAIKKVQENYLVCLATGRPLGLTRDVIADLDIKGPCIVLGGTQIVDSNGETIWEVALTDDQTEQIVQELASYKDCRFVVDDYSFDIYLSGGDYDYNRLKTVKNPKVIEPVFLSPERADDLVEVINKIPGVTAVKTTAHKEGCNDVHIMSSFATKEHAVTELLKITQIDVDKTTAVGDGHNDIHLFAAVKNKIAMGNAVPELKQAADRVIGSVQDDGLAEYLSELVHETV